MQLVGGWDEAGPISKLRIWISPSSWRVYLVICLAMALPLSFLFLPLWAGRHLYLLLIPFIGLTFFLAASSAPLFREWTGHRIEMARLQPGRNFGKEEKHRLDQDSHPARVRF
jgi:hypothetical protein